MMKELDKFFESFVRIPRIKVGKKQTIDTLINEEVLSLAKFLRNEARTLKFGLLEYRKKRESTFLPLAHWSGNAKLF